MSETTFTVSTIGIDLLRLLLSSFVIALLGHWLVKSIAWLLRVAGLQKKQSTDTKEVSGVGSSKHLSSGQLILAGFGSFALAVILLLVSNEPVWYYGFSVLSHLLFIIGLFTLFRYGKKRRVEKRSSSSQHSKHSAQSKAKEKATKPNQFSWPTWSWIMLAIIVVGGTFYWFQWRPSQIRQDCSWMVKSWWAGNIVRDGLTDEEQGILSDAPNNTTGVVTSGADQNYWRQFAGDDFADYKANFFMHENGETWRPHWVEATDQQYRACIRQNGLTQ